MNVMAMANANNDYNGFGLRLVEDGFGQVESENIV